MPRDRHHGDNHPRHRHQGEHGALSTPNMNTTKHPSHSDHGCERSEFETVRGQILYPPAIAVLQQEIPRLPRGSNSVDPFLQLSRHA
jgi:hypothetical protein